MTCYMIKIKKLYYGKENSINGRILDVSTTDDELLPYIVQEISYKTRQGAIKGAKKLQKIKNLKNKDIEIQGIIFK